MKLPRASFTVGKKKNRNQPPVFFAIGFFMGTRTPGDGQSVLGRKSTCCESLDMTGGEVAGETVVRQSVDSRYTTQGVQRSTAERKKHISWCGVLCRGGTRKRTKNPVEKQGRYTSQRAAYKCKKTEF